MVDTGSRSDSEWLKPPIWLQEGDVMTLGITGPGTQRQTVIGPR